MTLLIVFLAWLTRDTWDLPPEGLPSEMPSQAQTLEAAELAPPSVAGEPAPSSRKQASSTKLAAPPKIDPHDVPLSDVSFEFVRPDFFPVVVTRATLEVTLRDGTSRTVGVNGESSVTLRLPPGRCAVRVEARGYVHREQSILVEERRAGVREQGQQLPGQHERLVMWPIAKEWVAVVLLTHDGRPFTALAQDLGLEPKRLFFDVFAVRTQLSPPGDPGNPPEATAGRFHAPNGYVVDLPGGVIGWLELARDPPVWAGLSVLGSTVGWELIRPGDTQIAFEIDPTILDARCARLRLRVLDASTRAPSTDARVTLRADKSPHRRPDQEKLAPGPDGRVEFERVLPGRYELEVTRGEDLEQRRVELAEQQVLDLGDLLLQRNGSIELLVVDAEGAPISAFIEIAPLESGKRVDELYPPMLHRRSDERGRCKLPLPSVRSFVRARVEVGTSAGQPADGARTPSLLL
ncbi:MAG: hypothetical protein ABIP42_13660, partial [Planctomycetota bacterium]